MSEQEKFEETDITELLNHPYDDPNQSIICCFPITNFAMMSAGDSWCSLVARTHFIPTKVEKTTNPDRPWIVYLDFHFGQALLSPYKSCWEMSVEPTSTALMTVLKPKPINLELGKLYNTYLSAMNKHSWHVLSVPWGYGNDHILEGATLRQHDCVVLLDFIPEHRKAKVLTPNGLIGWIPSVLLKDL